MSKRLIAVGVMVLAGVMTAYALLSSGPPAPGQLEDGQPESRDAEIAALQRELRELESDLRVLRRDLDQARDEGLGRPAGVARAAADPKQAAIGYFGHDSQGEEAREAVMDALSSPDPEVRQKLRAVLQEEHERMRDEHMEEFQARHKARTMERLTQLASQAGLSQAQVQEVAGYLDKESEQVHQLFRDARRDHSFREARDQVDQIRQQTDQQVKDALEEEQFKAYQTMREEERDRWGRGGRGGRRGGGPPH